MARGTSKISKVPAGSKYALGTPDELAHRDAKVAFQPPGKAFKQLQEGPGGNANEPSRQAKSGNFKFSNGV